MMRETLRASVTNHIALTATLYGECRDQPVQGQIAVAAVIRNRFQSGRFGTTIAAVCTQKSQFSCWWEDAPNTTKVYLIVEAMMSGASLPIDKGEQAVFRQLKWIAAGIIAGDLLDNTGAALHYLASWMFQHQPPKWAKTATSSVEIGDHVFLRGVA